MRALGIDLGGTNLRYLCLDHTRRIVARGTIPARLGARAREDPQAAPSFVVEAVRAALRAVDSVDALGVAIAGFVREGVVVASPNIPGLVGWDAARALEEATGIPVRVHNDASLAALGEAVGGGWDAPLVHLTLGTGIGAGFYDGQRPWFGTHGTAMEIGHWKLARTRRRCGCGGRGCLETVASATGVVRSYGRPRLDAAAVARLADAGDAKAVRAFAQAGEALGRAAAMLALALDPAVITFGGGMSAAWRWLRAPLEDAFRAGVPDALHGQTRVARARTGAEAGALGAALFALG